MEAQAREIDALNEQLAPFRLLKGVEVNIRADGTLDVVRRGARRARLGRRVAAHGLRQEPDRAHLGAMENPHVDCIGHLTGARSAGGRRPRSTSNA